MREEDLRTEFPLLEEFSGSDESASKSVSTISVASESGREVKADIRGEMKEKRFDTGFSSIDARPWAWERSNWP